MKKTSVQIAEVIIPEIAQTYIGLNAKYVLAPTGRLFFGFRNRALKILDFDGIRFFEIDAKLDHIIEVPENYVKPILDGRETLLSLRDKLPGLIEQDAKAKAEAEAKLKAEQEAKLAKEAAAANEANKNQTPAGNGK